MNKQQHSLGVRHWRKRDAAWLALALVIVAVASTVHELRRWWA